MLRDQSGKQFPLLEPVEQTGIYSLLFSSCGVLKTNIMLFYDFLKMLEFFKLSLKIESIYTGNSPPVRTKKVNKLSVYIRMKNESVWDEDESTDEDDQSVVSSNPSHSSTQSPTLSSNHSPNLLSNQTSILNSNHHMSVSPNYSSNQATSLSSNHLYNYSVDTAIASSEELAAIQVLKG